MALLYLDQQHTRQRAGQKLHLTTNAGHVGAEAGNGGGQLGAVVPDKLVQPMDHGDVC